jgi:hypothetical protein
MTAITYSGSDDAEKQTATILTNLLRDCPPPEGDLAICGPYQEPVGELVASYHRGGLQSMQKAFTALSQAQPALARLVSADIGNGNQWTVAELLAADFPEPRWAVPGLVPVGLCILAGRPKVGKSWLALQLACAVATDGHFLGEGVNGG